MSSFTIHALEPVLDARLTERARLEGLSKNQLIKDLLAQATGLPTVHGYSDDYREFCGVWSVAETQEFSGSQNENCAVDAGDWQS